MCKLKTIEENWIGEYRLIDNIWSDKYPKDVEYELSWLEKFTMSLLVFFRTLSFSHVKWCARSKKGRTQIVEIYVLLRFVTLAILVTFPSYSFFYFIIVLYFLMEGFNYRLSVIFVDSYSKEFSLRSRNRSLIILIINYIEMIVAFAALYLNTKSISTSCQNGDLLESTIDSLYFSMVTITTLGYGDYAPCDTCGKLLVFFETLGGIIFVVLVVATFIGWGPSQFSKKKREKTGSDST